ITLCRTQLVMAEFPDEKTVRFHGILEDHIYAMEVEMDVSIPDGVITKVTGWMKRYTNPVCPQAMDVLQKAVGMSLREEGWMSKINREIGRLGCTHFAEIILECGRCLDEARLALAVGQTLEANPQTDPNQAARDWIDAHPETMIPCVT
ncbi:MAG: DUF2889 domain-containing protein, partial [Proteobacteria bacterium]|nr:DUF2889 domain-containing protein [Pseudomonadota bacterium]